MKPYKPANPLIWGAVLGIIAALIVLGSDLTGSYRADNPLMDTPFKAGLGFFGFGVLAAMFRNWFNERRHGP
jgi:hypothetical protein